MEGVDSVEMSDRVQKARENFLKGYNCAQSVFVAFADVMGVTEEEAARFSSPFGAGFGRLREVCGTVSAMTMVLGYLEGNADPNDQEGKTRIYTRERELVELFLKEQKSIVCREILGLEKGQEEPPAPSIRTLEYYESRPCLGCVETAARIIEQEILRK
jgi:C_GCAxxG_C_C family probable redox protein